MFITDKLVYIQLQKTGGSHIIRLLDQTVGGKQLGIHNPATGELLDSSTMFISSIRNPWEWYVSLWSYGCDRKGGFFNTVTKRTLRSLYHAKNPLQMGRVIYHQLKKKTENWQRCYADSNDSSLFREWLQMVFDPEFRFDLGEGYGDSGVHTVAGIYTYRYLRICCLNPHLLSTTAFKSVSDIKRFEKNYCYISRWIRNESLEHDFKDIVNFSGEKLTLDDVNLVHSQKKINVSSRSGPIGSYYDEKTAKLVREKEALIVNKFGYAFPQEGFL